ncbi:MAG: hypothetical protein JW791_00770 [Nanoarchaeota archaeon]|nr:hypothetical protein [Nanoarchaeota archaeon]
MGDSCPMCKFVLVNNDEPLNVLKMLRVRKNNGDDKKYPLLVADFHCPKCEKTMHVKWVDLEKDLNVMNCEACSTPLNATIFLGVMSGFELHSYCFSCYNKLNSGSVGFQK